MLAFKIPNIWIFYNCTYTACLRNLQLPLHPTSPPKNVQATLLLLTQQ